MAIEQVTDANFADEVEGSSTPVLVDFWAEWCGPCRMMNPILEAFESKHGEQVRVAKLNVDESPQTAGRFQVLSIPTMLVFQDGQPVKQMVGAMSAQRLEEALAEWVNATA